MEEQHQRQNNDNDQQDQINELRDQVARILDILLGKGKGTAEETHPPAALPTTESNGPSSSNQRVPHCTHRGTLSNNRGRSHISLHRHP